MVGGIFSKWRGIMHVYLLHLRFVLWQKSKASSEIEGRQKPKDLLCSTTEWEHEAKQRPTASRVPHSVLLWSCFGGYQILSTYVNGFITHFPWRSENTINYGGCYVALT